MLPSTFRLPQFLSSSLRLPIQIFSQPPVRIIAILVLANIVIWSAVAIVLRYHPLLTSPALLSYTLGLRHALDADHISAIDLMTRRLIASGQKPVTVGTFFSLGHSTIVIITCIVVAATSGALEKRERLDFVEIIWAHEGVAEKWKCRKRYGFRFGGRWDNGVLFGLGFDTSSEVAVLGIASLQGAQGTSLWLILIFPLLFTAGMCLLDTTDGALMMTLYTSTSLARDAIAILYYSIVLTAITVFVAICIGTIQLLSLIANFSEGPFWDGIDIIGDHFDIIGGSICGAFVVFGAASVVAYGPWRRWADKGQRGNIGEGVELQAINDKTLAEKNVEVGPAREINTKVQDSLSILDIDLLASLALNCQCLARFQTIYNEVMFDDFVVTHINLTPYVHNSGTFLGWHRYYLWIYEEALKTECGFTGSIPYWEWSKWADAPQDSPIFNGDDYSMGGNGEYIPHGDYVFNEQPPITLPAGLGGGCVTTGPFKDYVVNLGPIAMDDGSTVGPDGGLGYNPRCMTRDVGPGVAMKYTNWTAVMANVGDFQSELQGRLGSGTIGVHGGGHYTIGGNPGGDIFVSPADPTFYLHHAQIDRLWTIWQAMDPKNRQYELSGTNTMYNVPPSENTTLDYMINVTYSGGGEIAMRDVMSTTAGPFCYIYL
ncbi:hypothetical protein B7494_g4970 [Chlorociboria aeruginascens]|nr:hypothetical protein B7494_g4970 [Chlorociboria aeruginascens]